MSIRLVCAAIAIALLAPSARAQLDAARVIRFDPPDPTDATPITVHVSGPNQMSCVLDIADAVIEGSTVIVTVHASQCGLYPPSPDAWFHAAVRVPPLAAGRYNVAVRVDAFGSITATGSTTLAVREAAPRFEVVPNVVTGFGTESVELIGNGINNPCRGGCPILVHLGDAVVDVSKELSSLNSIHVPVPRHAAGIVDVSIEENGAITFRSKSALQFTGLGPGDPAFVEQVLLPVILNAPGAFGSQWKTDLALYNGNDYALSGSWTVMCDPPPCAGPQPHSIFTVGGVNLPEGAVLPLPRQAANRVSIAVLARDLSRQAEALGAELPVVHEPDLRDGMFSLLNVPADARFRVALRLYGVDYVRGVTMRIRPMNNGANDILTQGIALTPSPEQSGRTATFAYVGDLITKNPELLGRGPLHVEIDSLGARIWGFISVTNNVTQHVTVITPQ